MRIGIDIRLIGKRRTGDETVFFNLVKNLAIAGRQNEYFLFTDRSPEKDPALAGEIERLELADNFKIITVNSPNRFWWNLWALPNHLRENPVDIFHTQYIAPFWLPKSVRLVLTIHDISFNFFPQYIKFSDLFFLKNLIPRSLRRANKIITVSRSERSQIAKFYEIPVEKISCVYNGADFKRFSKDWSADEKEKIREKYTLPEKFLLYVGTMQPRKNLPALVEAIKVYIDRHSDDNIRLVVVGNRKARNFDKKIDETVKKYSLEQNVIFPGWIEDKDLPAVYKLAECFVFPSLYEGFGIPIVEAMAAGIPVVSSNKSCLPEVGDDAALFANPDNPEEFAEKIRQALTDGNMRKNLIEKGIKRAKIFSWQKTAQKTLEVYESITD